MDAILSEAESPEGLHMRYIVTKANGDPVDPDAFYFVLRIDSGGDDRRHLKACHEAALVYCDHIEEFLPDLAKDLRRRVIQEQAGLALMRTDGYQERSSR